MAKELPARGIDMYIDVDVCADIYIGIDDHECHECMTAWLHGHMHVGAIDVAVCCFPAAPGSWAQGWYVVGCRW